MTTAHEILQAAQSHMKDRASTYDKPEGERSMQGTVGAFRAITGVSLTEEQGWLFMAVLKAVRSQQGVYVHGRIDRSEKLRGLDRLVDDVHGRIDRSENYMPFVPIADIVHGRIDRSEITTENFSPSRSNATTPST